MGELTSMALFGLGLSLGAFELGKLIQKKCKNPAANPLLIAIVLVIAVLQIFHIPVSYTHLNPLSFATPKSFQRIR